MTREYNNVRITAPALPAAGGKVVLNGVELKDVVGMSMKSHVDEVTEFTVTILANVNPT